MSGHVFPSARSDDEPVLSASVCERTRKGGGVAQQKPATPTQAESAVGLPLRWMVASIRPYGRSAA